MEEYINREAAMRAVLGEPTDAHYPGWYAAILMELPAADVAPVMHGRWIMHADELGLTCECSVCHIETMCDGNYCPNCGARMDIQDGGDNDAPNVVHI